MFDLTDVRFIKRIVIGSDNAAQIRTKAEVEESLALLNRCLTDRPVGKLIATEKSFTLVQVGEHQVVLQWIAYHVGFVRRPDWLNE